MDLLHNRLVQFVKKISCFLRKPKIHYRDLHGRVATPYREPDKSSPYFILCLMGTDVWCFLSPPMNRLWCSLSPPMNPFSIILVHSTAVCSSSFSMSVIWLAFLLIHNLIKLIILSKNDTLYFLSLLFLPDSYCLVAYFPLGTPFPKDLTVWASV